MADFTGLQNNLIMRASPQRPKLMVTEPVYDNNEEMAQLLGEEESQYHSLHRGEVVDGVIMKVDRDGLLVNVGQKTEGVLPSREMRSLEPEVIDALKVGDSIVVAVVRPETDEGQAVLSVDRAQGERGWRKLQEYAEQGVVIEAQVSGYNKGGAIVSVEGVQAFVPLSQLSNVPRTPPDAEENKGLAALVGSALQLKVIEVTRRRNRAILSERAATQEQRQQKKEQLMEELAEGETRKGRVSGITNFGVFIDLGGADGLVHISELSWDPVRSPEEVVQIGDEVDVFVIKVDREAKRIALSLKRIRQEPWAAVGDKYQTGQTVSATITRLTTFGAFARLEGSIEGLIHISEMADRIISHPKEVVREGDQVSVKILKVDPERRRMGLSLKQGDEGDEQANSMMSYGRDEGEPLVDRPALNAEMAVELTRAVSLSEGEASAADDPEPVDEPEPAADPEPADEPETVDEPEPVADPEPADEPETVDEPEPVADPEPADEPETVDEPEPAADPKPDADLEPVEPIESVDALEDERKGAEQSVE